MSVPVGAPRRWQGTRRASCLSRNEEEAARWTRKGKMRQAEGTGVSILGTAGAFCDGGGGLLPIPS